MLDPGNQVFLRMCGFCGNEDRVVTGEDGRRPVALVHVEVDHTAPRDLALGLKGVGSSSSNDSCSITWHQWQVAYPIDRKIGRSSSRATPNASSPHGYQSTGLWAC